MPDESPLLSTLLELPGGRRAEVERELVEVTRLAALGGLAADVAHDVGNALFGAAGLAELLLADAEPGSEEASRLRLLRTTLGEIEASFGAFVDAARPAQDERREAVLGDAVAEAVGLARHGEGRLELEARSAGPPATVPCPPGLLVQAVLQLIVAARGADRVVVSVEGRTVTVEPVTRPTLGLAAAARIAADHGGTLGCDGAAATLRW